MSASKARQKVQITLKVIESLSYNCDDTVVLQKLDSMLNEVERKFREKLPHHEGLLLRPALITDAAKKVSLKYKKMRLSTCMVRFPYTLKYVPGRKTGGTETE